MKIVIKKGCKKEKNVTSYNVEVYRSEHSSILQFKGIIRVAVFENLTYVRQFLPEKGESMLHQFAFKQQLENILVTHHKKMQK